MACDDCGKEGGVKMLCPYAQEINEEEIEVILCKPCEYERCMAI